MSTLETRIAETLAASDSAHQFKKAEQMNTDYPHFWCSCGVQTIGRGKFPEHVRQASAAALATVIAEAQAKALREAADKFQTGDWFNVIQGNARVKIGNGQRVTDWLRSRADKLVTE